MTSVTVTTRSFVPGYNGTLLRLNVPSAWLTRTAKVGELLTPKEREELRWYLETYLTSPYGVWADQGRGIEERFPDLGQRLFSALFGQGMSTRDLYRAVKGEKLEIWISSMDPVFLGMPWELMWNPDEPECLALAGVSVNRTIPGAGANSFTQEYTEPLRVLMAICRPSGRRDVPYQIVARRLIPILEHLEGRVELDLLRPPTEDELWKQVERAREEGRPYHVMHFDGHGALVRYKKAGRMGYVVFEDDQGEADPVAADDFAQRFTDAGIPLLVLNACQSAMVDADAPPGSVVATRLLQAGVPAVVAMGYSVYARAAAEFMAVFYDALFAGLNVSEAMARGRARLKSHNLRPSPKGDMPLLDWVVPVHYASQYVAFQNLAAERKARPTPREAMDEILAKASEGPGEKDDFAATGEFFGRDNEFLELERALWVRHVVVLHGIGGSGKTELAKAFARWFRLSGGADRPEWVIWQDFIPGGSTHNLDGYLTLLGLKVRGPDFILAYDTPEKRMEAVLSFMEKFRILVVWDNFESARSMPAPQAVGKGMDEKECNKIRAFLHEVGRQARVGVVITSRAEEEWLGGPDRISRVPVHGLLPHDADQYADSLLAGLSHAQEQRKDLAFPELMKILAGHPLSLRLVLPFLEVFPVKDLKKGLLGRGALPPELQDDRAGRMESLAASVSYSLDYIPEPHSSRLCALALFEGAVDQAILWTMSEMEGVPGRFAGISKEEWEETLSLAGGLGLLTQTFLSGLWCLHPALPSFFLKRWQKQAGRDFDNELQDAQEAWTRTHAVMGAWLDKQIDGGAAKVAFAMLKTCKGNLSYAIALALEWQWFDEIQMILRPLNAYWDAQGLVAEAEEWVDRCLEATESPTGERPPWNTPAGTLWRFVKIARANRKLEAGNLEEAEIAYIELSKALNGESDPEALRRIAVDYHQLGRVAADRGDLDKAAVWYRKSLEIDEELGDLLGLASSYNQLGVVAHQLGDLDKAEGYYKQGLAIVKELKNRPYAAAMYHQLCIVAQDRSDLYNAEKWCHKSLEIEEELGNRPGQAMAYHQLGRVALERGDLYRAEEWCRRSLEIKEELGDRPGMAITYSQLGRVAAEQGELDNAEEWYRKSLEISEELGDRLGLAKGYGQMGWLEMERNISDTALEWMVRCVCLFEEFPHPSTTPVPHNMAVVTKMIGLEALEASWLKVTGNDLPGHVREYVEGMMAEMKKEKEG